MPRPEPDIDPSLHESLALDQGIFDAFGFQMHLARDGVCEIDCSVPANLVNAGGYAHGSIVYALMDTACAYALRSRGRRGVTVHGDVNYVAGGVADTRFIARVEVASLSRRVGTLRGTVHIVDGENQQLAAHGSFVFQLVAESAS